MADNKPLKVNDSDTVFIATEPIEVGGFRAHNVGDEVLAANVKANGWEAKVARPETKAATAATDDAA